MKGQIVVYSIIGCPYCLRAKGYLDQLGLTYIDINLDKNPVARQDLVALGKKTVPQIYFNEIHVGGWDDISKIVCTQFTLHTYIYILVFLNNFMTDGGLGRSLMKTLVLDRLPRINNSFGN